MRQKPFVWRLTILGISLCLLSCASSNSQSKNYPRVRYRVIDCPVEIRKAAVSYGHKYVERENEYLWGARDYLEKDGILQLDCSGFMVRIFQYAVKGTKYSLLFKDSPLSGFYENFTVPIDISMATPGDIIFMGTDKDVPPSHMSIFTGIDDDNIYFMDATLKEEDGIDGVTLRYYPKDDPKFLFFARLLIKY